MLGFLSSPTVIIPIAAAAMVFVLIIIILLVAKNYHKVPPNEALVIFGRKYADPESPAGPKVGFKIVSGGAAFVIPFLETCERLSLDAFQVDLTVNKVPSKEGVRVTVQSVASLKIGSDFGLLKAAVQRFLDLDLNGIKKFSQEILEGCLRGVVATMTVEGLVQDRTRFGQEVQEQVKGDLVTLGLELDNFTIKDISDEMGYIDALGEGRTAEVKKEAAIKRAAAKRDEDIEVADAQREADEKSSEARRIGETAKAKADQEISDANRERDKKIANNEAAVKAEQAKIEKTAQIAETEKDRELRVARVKAQEAETEAQTKLQEKEKERMDAELKASIVVSAERKKEADIIEAEGVQKATVIKADGDREAQELLAAGQLVASERSADGRKALAQANKAELEAQADGEKAKLLAQAQGIEAKLLAEAKGTEEKALAFAKLDSAGRLMLILEAAPGVIDHIGLAVKTAGEGTLKPMAEAIGDGLGNVGEIRIVDLGSGADGNTPLQKFTGIVPMTLVAFAEKIRAAGVWDAFAELAHKVGFDPEAILGTPSNAEPKDNTDRPASTEDPSLVRVDVVEEEEPSLATDDEDGRTSTELEEVLTDDTPEDDEGELADIDDQEGSNDESNEDSDDESPETKK